MKPLKYFLIFLISLLTISVTAQQGINYKALVKDGTGNVVANDLIVVQFQILEGVGMTNVYQESHTATTDANGFVIINIGEGIIDSGVFADVVWGADDHYLNVQINTGGGLTDMGTTEFKTVPYALHAKTIDNPASGLELINEGVGTGWRLIGRDPANFDDIGNHAVDLSYSIGAPELLYGASGTNSTAMGYETTASGSGSTAMGLVTTAFGNYSTAMGAGTTASGSRSTAMGSVTTASGNNSTAMGINTTAQPYGSTVVGQYNVIEGSQASWEPTDPLFVIGNGTSSVPANALTVLKNGNTSIGNNAPESHRLYVTSNATGATGTTGIFINTAASGIALAVENSSSVSSDNVFLVSSYGSTGNLASFDSYQGTGSWNRRFRFTNAGDGRCDGAWIAGGADYAEYFPKANTSLSYEPGDVIAMSPSIGYTVESANAANANLVIGVYSSNPAIVGNSSAEEDPEDAVLVGLMGVIATKVNTENGPIKIGDFLTISSTSGVATKANRSGMVIGRAMENYTASNQGMIKVLVATEWITMESQMDVLKHKNEALNTIVKSLTAELVGTKEEQSSSYKKLLKRVEKIEANSNQ